LAATTKKFLKLQINIDTESSNTYKTDDLDKRMEQAQHQRVMLISDTAGMGKSTVLTHLSKRIKQNLVNRLTVRNNNSEQLENFLLEDTLLAVEYQVITVLKNFLSWSKL
jgi:ATP/maltotriose-dependent transcriptional regulator MalT